MQKLFSLHLIRTPQCSDMLNYNINGGYVPNFNNFKCSAAEKTGRGTLRVCSIASLFNSERPCVQSRNLKTDYLSFWALKIAEMWNTIISFILHFHILKHWRILIKWREHNCCNFWFYILSWVVAFGHLFCTLLYIKYLYGCDIYVKTCRKQWNHIWS